MRNLVRERNIVQVDIEDTYSALRWITCLSVLDVSGVDECGRASPAMDEFAMPAKTWWTTSMYSLTTETLSRTTLASTN